MPTTETCDQCGDPYLKADRRTIRLPRPSDPTDLCAIMYFGPCCGDEDGPSCKTEANWDRYIESPEAVAAGYMFLT